MSLVGIERLGTSQCKCYFYWKWTGCSSLIAAWLWGQESQESSGQLSWEGKCCVVTQRQETKEQDSLGAEQTLPSKSALSWLRRLYVEAPRCLPDLQLSWASCVHPTSLLLAATAGEEQALLSTPCSTPPDICFGRELWASLRYWKAVVQALYFSFQGQNENFWFPSFQDSIFNHNRYT